jgi:23S rRNA (uracil1939-C5)-methyltransferase
MAELFEATISSLVYGGWALGRLGDGRAAFVPYLLPGERARIRVTESRPGWVRGRAVELLEASPQRIAPRCRHFGECGGCHYQHLGYAGQLEAKRRILAEQLSRLAGLAEVPLGPPVPSPSPWNYRNHMQFHRSSDGRPGFRAFRSSRVVPIAECHLPEPELNELWPRLPPEPAGGRFSLRRGTSGPPVSGEAPPAGGPPPGPVEFALPFARLLASPQSFFQVNTPMAAALAGEAVRALTGGLPGGGRSAEVLDLYCGVGLFSAALSPFVRAVVGVELSAPACADFRRNLKGRENVRLIEGDVGAALADPALRAQAAVADPPRAGLGLRVVQALAARAGLALLVYVSCDPATLARDAKELARRGFQLRSLRLFDLFPQTYHLETVGIWSRAGVPGILAP